MENNQPSFTDAMLSMYFSHGLSVVVDTTASNLLQGIKAGESLASWVTPDSSQLELLAFFSEVTKTELTELPDGGLYPNVVAQLKTLYRTILSLNDADREKLIKRAFDYKLSRSTTVLEAFVWVDNEQVQQAAAIRNAEEDIAHVIKTILSDDK